MRLHPFSRKSVDRSSTESCDAPHSSDAGTVSHEDLESDYVRACALHDAGRHLEAHRLLCRLRDGGFTARGFARRLGWSHLSLAHEREAEECMRQAIGQDPDDWQCRYALGEVQRARDPGAAKVTFMQVLSRLPENEPCLLGLCTCHLALKEASLAEAVAQRVTEISPQSMAAWTNLGAALAMQGRLCEAEDAFAVGESLAASAEHHVELNRGLALRLQGRTSEAIQYYETLLPAAPSISAHSNYSLALLTAGRLSEGWDQYEFRWLDEPLVRERARYEQPAWNGQALDGKTILVRCEQGAGDVFQFIRYVPPLKRMGATVLLELHLELGILGKSFSGVDRTYRRGEQLPSFDYFVDLLSLPRVLRTTLSSIPTEVPYLEAPARWCAQWRDRMAAEAGLKVGLVWAGDPKHPRDALRSISLAALKPLVEMSGIRWFSLQKGSAAQAAVDVGLEDRIVSLGPRLYEYADTAAVIDSLDLVVTVDTSAAHLAGALGKPVWLLLPFLADWRWMEGRDSSPWYPTMRIFRQARPDDWPDVVRRVQAALAGFETGNLLHSPQSASGEAAAGEVVAAPLKAAIERPHVRGLSRVAHTRFGMIQFVPGQSRMSDCLEYYGDFLQHQVDVARSLLTDGDVLVEFAAGIGFHAIALAGAVGTNGQVMAIEQAPLLRRILRQNIDTNGVRNVSVILSATQESLDGLAFERVSLLKINDASDAARVLEGGIETVRRHAPILMVGGPSRESLEPVRKHAAALDYRCWSCELPLFDAANFNHRKDDLFGGERSYLLLALPKIREIPEAITAMPVTFVLS